VPGRAAHEGRSGHNVGEQPFFKPTNDLQMAMPFVNYAVRLPNHDRELVVSVAR
jgi:hypothetical protein